MIKFCTWYAQLNSDKCSVVTTNNEDIISMISYQQYNVGSFNDTMSSAYYTDNNQRLYMTHFKHTSGASSPFKYLL